MKKVLVGFKLWFVFLIRHFKSLPLYLTSKTLRPQPDSHISIGDDCDPDFLKDLIEWGKSNEAKDQNSHNNEDTQADRDQKAREAWADKYSNVETYLPKRENAVLDDYDK